MREAVALERKELEQLHKIDVAKTALDQLVKEYADAKQQLEQEMAEVRGQWAQEKQKVEEEQEHSEEERKLQRQREKEEFEYERKKDHDAYDEARRTQELQNKEKQEALEKTWAGREASLKERGDELARLRQEAVLFPDRLKKEIDKAIFETTKTLESQHKQTFALAQKGMEAERRPADLRIKSLDETVSRQLEEIKSLSIRFEESKKQVQDIAVKAIEGASGARALTHVSQIAMEQAKPRSPQS